MNYFLNFLKTQDLKNNNYLSKNHYLPNKKSRNHILSHPDVRMLLILRDPKDMVVCLIFFHEKRLGNYSPSTLFPWNDRGKTEPEQFYWRRGENRSARC